jgi:hypothetical protein
MDEEVVTTERRAFNVVDVFTKFGGMLGIVATLGKVLLSSL